MVRNGHSPGAKLRVRNFPTNETIQLVKVSRFAVRSFEGEVAPAASERLELTGDPRSFMSSPTIHCAGPNIRAKTKKLKKQGEFDIFRRAIYSWLRRIRT
jgi:hypothetical protein